MYLKVLKQTDFIASTAVGIENENDMSNKIALRSYTVTGLRS